MSAEEDFVDPEWLLAVVGTLVPAQAGGMPAASDLEEFREVAPGGGKVDLRSPGGVAGGA